ncbi:hypothetical protein AMS68_005128 [Peltaster fructicola]|uniref:RNA helicase n=1 Tax=Peltaster fructicola TaxID=286661 RepID=A0A6H0XY68_9PEZI|nr:hypothetical protein AMS68_005128 [Peltaster fructicola]
MAGGNKKKKKPAANPARGFATTSTVSKVKAEAIAEATQPTPEPKKESIASPRRTVNSADVQLAATEVKELHELTPEQLEAELEASDLQRIIEQYAGKIRKESSRQSIRLQTEKRLLRGQADYLSVKEWLPDEVMQQVLDLLPTHGVDDRPPNRPQMQMVGDELLSRVWQLHECLIDLGFSVSRAREAIAHVVSQPGSSEATSLSWGLAEALEWFALQCDASEFTDYDVQTKRSILEPDDFMEDIVEEQTIQPNNTTFTTNGTSDQPDIEVSDLDSDLEPDELLAVYLQTKARLFDLDPTADDKPLKKGKQAPQQAVATPGQKKLRQKLGKIRSDLLFDVQTADMQWEARKIDLLREQAERKRLRLDDKPSNSTSRNGETQNSTTAKNTTAEDINAEAERLGQELLQQAEDDELLGGMFDALPSIATAGTHTAQADSADLVIRDFGKLTGLNPKRVLEEACKARDSRCKLTYRMISPTTYACRHSVTIQWSKEQDATLSRLQAVMTRRKATTIVFDMIHVATSDIAQSEAYVATAALFMIFSDSAKESKASLRLPPAFRDLWEEFVKEKQEATDAVDRQTVKELRTLIEKNTPVEIEDDEIVYNPALRRTNGTSGTNTPTHRIVDPGPSQALMDMWHSKIATPSYQQMLQVRSKLPMFNFRAAALETISRHQVSILCGETGCGKSTQLPAFIVEHQLSQGIDCKIYCTEPRRISAISLAQRVSEEMGERKGDVGTNRSLVGYAIRLESHTAASTRVIYATVGIVLRMLESSDGLKDITHLVLDEVHERSIDTDFLLIVLRSLLIRRPDLKVVLMSATVDAQRFSNYFDGAPIITVPGRTFPVQARFLEDAIELTGHTVDDATRPDENDADFDDTESGQGQGGDLSAYSKLTRSTLARYDEYRIDYSLIVKLLEKVAYDTAYSQFSQAVLVFLPGIAEIRQLNDMLVGHPSFSRGWQVYPLHSSFSSEDQQAAFLVPPQGTRKIVLATNIAETGITIPDVTCVIDTGKHKEMRFDERRQMSRLIQSFIARANAKQRRGRAGRVQEGICFHLFTKYRHDNLMVDQQTPEMLRLSLQDLVMRVKICKLGDIEGVLAQALDPPASKNIRRAIDALVEVDALTASEELTPLGSQLAKLPLDAQLGKLLLLGSIYGCLDFALTTAATLSAKSPFLSPMHAKKQADTIRLGYKRGNSDLLTVYNAYCTWKKVCLTAGMPEHQFCNKNFLSSQNLANIEDLKAQLLNSLADTGFVVLGPEEKTALSKMRYNQRHRHFVQLPQAHCRADDNDDITNSVVAWAFYPKLLRRDGKGWRNVANNQSLGLHPTSVNKYLADQDIKNLSFYSIMQTSSRFTNAQETSPVSDYALVMSAGEATFNLYAGVIVIDGNRLRFKVSNWKTMIVLKVLRARFKECQARMLKSPGKELGMKLRKWMEIHEMILMKRSLA